MRGTSPVFGVFFLVLSFAGVAAPANCRDRGGVVLWTRDKPAVAVVLADNPIPAERTAAGELADYLEKASGFKFVIASESDKTRLGPGIYVGLTNRAKANGLDAVSWGAEQWAVRTAGGDLMLAGGRPRGTLYAVYHFLEDVLGVRWWNPFEESVPRREALQTGALDSGGQPRFAYRDIFHLYANDNGRFAARNRVNGDGFGTIIDAAFGSGVEFGPPYGVHTFYLYIPPDEYFSAHPEWFSLLRGKRTAAGAQLCLTNPALREEVTRKLRGFIESSRAAATQAGRPQPRDFDISQNDRGGMCECPDCRELVRQEGSHSGPLIFFLNGIAAAISTDYPDVRINTLAYQLTEAPPRTLLPMDTVVPRLCDTNANLLRPITHPDNRAFAERVARWGEIVKILRIWDYAVTYKPYPGLPLPSAHTYAPDYRYFAEHNVEGVFTEHEYPIRADMRDFKLWIMMKLLEDPYRDYETLARDFTDGFYGAAGVHVLRYLKELEAAAARVNADVNWLKSPALADYRYLTLDFLRQAQATFDDAERSIGADATLLNRVRHARLPLDRACLVLWPKLNDEWAAAGGAPGTFPLVRTVIEDRARLTWYAQVDLRFPQSQRDAQRVLADEDLLMLKGAGR